MLPFESLVKSKKEPSCRSHVKTPRQRMPQARPSRFELYPEPWAPAKDTAKATAKPFGGVDLRIGFFRGHKSALPMTPPFLRVGNEGTSPFLLFTPKAKLILTYSCTGVGFLSSSTWVCDLPFARLLCSPAKSLTFSGLMEHSLVGKKLKS